jgi:hypothetical protein
VVQGECDSGREADHAAQEHPDQDSIGENFTERTAVNVLHPNADAWDDHERAGKTNEQSDREGGPAVVGR